jgi:hypothetical protein
VVLPGNLHPQFFPGSEQLRRESLLPLPHIRSVRMTPRERRNRSNGAVEVRQRTRTKATDIIYRTSISHGAEQRADRDEHHRTRRFLEHAMHLLFFYAKVFVERKIETVYC